ncbi:MULTISPECIES: hypothetical protein [Burkholderia]|uniref:hypothetical protein n=1 Tax=Burkholderia TaxID=32008 RepID=UPI000B79CC29|nr:MULTISPECIES: hypothetical protein [Burkholderia]MBY4725715.1 hypothetical protein [Burkholderia contaminans]MCI3969253.1 hypothetical protein [Burkholderia sp. HI4860]OXI98486.1 hypothetical protein CFB48_24110 [Burkholderia sp. AU33647]
MNLIEQFDSILAQLQEVGVKGLIAGGAVRDHILGKQVKDIDVFVAHDPDVVSKLQAAFGVLHVNPSLAAEYIGEVGQSEVSHVYGVTSSSDPFDTANTHRVPVQVIVLAPGMDPLDRVKHHDFGICQCWYEGAGKNGFTGAFFDDAASKQFTLSHCEDQHQFDRSMRRWERFKERFPEFSLYVPFRFREYTEVFA